MANRRAPLGLLFLLLALAIAGFGYWLILSQKVPGTSGLREPLTDRGKVAVVGDSDLLRLSAEGAELVPASEVAGLEAALEGEDEGAVARVMRERGVAALLVLLVVSVSGTVLVISTVLVKMASRLVAELALVVKTMVPLAPAARVGVNQVRIGKVTVGPLIAGFSLTKPP